MKNHFFRTDRLIVRPLTEADYAEWYRAHTSALPRQNAFDHRLANHQINRKDFQSMVTCDRSLRDADLTYSFAGFSSDNTVLIGGVQVWCVQRQECQRATLGFWIFNNYWGQGYGTEIARGMIAYAFEKLCLNRLEAELLPENVSSEQVCKKLGMTCEGIRRQALAVDGQFRDHIVYSIVAEEFQKPKKTTRTRRSGHES